jgi:hypothetical protein
MLVGMRGDCLACGKMKDQASLYAERSPFASGACMRFRSHFRKWHLDCCGVQKMGGLCRKQTPAAVGLCTSAFKTAQEIATPTHAPQRTESKSTSANMENMLGRRLLTASLFGGVSEELTGEQSKLDMELQTLVKHAKVCREVSRDEIVAQVIEVAKKYPDIVDLQPLDGGPRRSFKSGGKNKSAG